MSVFDTMITIVYAVGFIVAIPIVVKIYLLSKQLSNELKNDPDWRHHL